MIFGSGGLSPTAAADCPHAGDAVRSRLIAAAPMRRLLNLNVRAIILHSSLSALRLWIRVENIRRNRLTNGWGLPISRSPCERSSLLQLLLTAEPIASRSSCQARNFARSQNSMAFLTRLHF